MDLGLGLIAADQYFKEGDDRVLRQRAQERYDAEKQRTASELSLLDDKAAAERTGYQLRTGQNQANSSLLPDQTANAKTRLGLDAKDLTGQAERQGDEIKTKGINAQIGLSNAQNTQANLPTQQEVSNNALKGQLMTSQADLQMLPEKLHRAAVQGELDSQGQSDVVLGTMGQLISRQDKAGALEFANKIAKTSSILPNTNGKTFTDIVPVRKGERGAPGDGYIFVTSDGERKFTPVEAISGAMNKLKTGKYNFIHDRFGNVYSGNESTGSVSKVASADPTTLAAIHGEHTPADIQSTQWLMANVPKFKGNPEAAWDAVRSSKEKTRNAFIMDYVSKNALPGADTNKMATDAGAIYDSLRSSQTPSNSHGTGKFDPAIAPLIGIP